VTEAFIHHHARQPLAGRAFHFGDFFMSPSTARARTSGPRLELGKVTITDAATAALERTGTEGVLLLARHLHGNWGDLCEQDALQNELALLLGLRVLSCYAIADGIRIWIVTEADRKTTTIMLPDGY
jgi:hypothetical protein